jgi:hypothetical protein
VILTAEGFRDGGYRALPEPGAARQHRASDGSEEPPLLLGSQHQPKPGVQTGSKTGVTI